MGKAQLDNREEKKPPSSVKKQSSLLYVIHLACAQRFLLLLLLLFVPWFWFSGNQGWLLKTQSHFSVPSQRTKKKIRRV
jgi:hypothetical protein